MPSDRAKIQSRRDAGPAAPRGPHIQVVQPPPGDAITARLDELCRILLAAHERIDAIEERLLYCEAAMHHVCDQAGIDTHCLPHPFEPHCYVVDPRRRPQVPDADVD